jgi:cytochrome b561
MTVRQTAIAEAGARYSAAAMLLHWLIAAFIILQLAMGWYMDDLEDDGAALDVERVHISIGLIVLVLSVARIALRLTRPAPPVPAGMPKWERALAGATHGLFYLLILAIPLTGWAMESLGPRPIPFFGLEWPHMPFLGGRPREQTRSLHEALEGAHGSVLVWMTIGLLALHVLGALKHQFDGRPVLYRMLPFMAPPTAK